MSKPAYDVVIRREMSRGNRSSDFANVASSVQKVDNDD